MNSKHMIKQIKICSKRDDTGAISSLNKRNFEDEELPYELFLTTTESTKIINAFANNMSRDIKLSKAHICKIIQSSGSFWF